MNCTEYREILFGGRQDEDWRKHGTFCTACAAFRRDAERQEKILASARVPFAPADLWSRIEARIPQEPVLEFRKGDPVGEIRKPRLAWLAAAAAILVAIVGLTLAGSSPRPTPTLRIKVVDAPPQAATALGTVVPTYDDVDTRTAMLDTLTAPVRTEGRSK